MVDKFQLNARNGFSFFCFLCNFRLSIFPLSLQIDQDNLPRGRSSSSRATVRWKKYTEQNGFRCSMERGREGEREGEKHQCCLVCPRLGTWPRNPGMCPDWESNQRPFGSQAGTPSTKPRQPRLNCFNNSGKPWLWFWMRIAGYLVYGIDCGDNFIGIYLCLNS